MLAHAVVLKPSPRRGVSGFVTLAVTIALLSACATSGPVYDMRGRGVANPPSTAATPGVPTASASPPVAKAGDAARVDAAPYSAAVAARFSEPKVTYKTPACAPSHRAIKKP